jgi:hypothetical protein
MFVFGTIVFVGQQLTGTDIVFSLLTVSYIALWVWGVNVAGGIEYTSGAFIFFNGIFTCLLGIGAKVLLFERGDGNLTSPRITMLVYCVGMAGMLVAATITRGLRPREPLLKNFDNLEQMKQAALVCLIFGTFLAITSGSSETASGSITTAVRQINRFPLMAVILATAYEITRSNGKRSVNWLVLASIGMNFGLGLIYFSKGGMLIGPTAWFITGVLKGYSFSKKQLIGSVLAGSFVVYYLVPYSQYVRVFTTSSKIENLAIAMKYLSDLPETRRLYLDSIANHEIVDEPHFFNERMSFLDRAVIIAADDQLIDFTEAGNVFGLEPTYQGWANVVPHFIWKDKVPFNTGNVYAHELGGLADEDNTTGISFSPAADAFHQLSWLGLLLLLPLTCLIAFMVTDSIAGNSSQAPWAMLWILEATHVAPEAALDGLIYFATYGVIGILFLYVVTKWVTPFTLNTLLNRKSTPSSQKERLPAGV